MLDDSYLVFVIGSIFLLGILNVGGCENLIYIGISNVFFLFLCFFRLVFCKVGVEFIICVI